MTTADLERLRALASDVGPPLAAPPGGELAGLPAAHAEALTVLNGATFGRGAFRFFGVGRRPELDLATWNAEDTWRFAWGGAADGYLFIGENAWGDQYAYRRGPDGELGPEVYFLDCIALSAEKLADSFEEFLAGELLRNAEQPYEPVTAAMIERNDGISVDQHWVHTPAPALGGDDTSLENVMELPAVVAMIFAGDIAAALDREPDGDPAQVQPWTDEAGRARLRLTFR